VGQETGTHGSGTAGGEVTLLPTVTTSA